MAIFREFGLAAFEIAAIGGFCVAILTWADYLKGAPL